MRWLIAQSNGEHSSSKHMRECFALKFALEQNGQNVTIWGKRHDGYRPMEAYSFNKFDIIYVLEQYEFDFLPDLDYLRPYKIHHIIDIHAISPSHYYPISKKCDLILHATKPLMDKYASRLPVQKHFYMPNGTDTLHFDSIKHPKSEQTKNDLIFVGSDLPQRRATINALKRSVGLKQYFAIGQEYIDLINSAKICFNKSIAQDCNYRIFEVCGLSTCLITNYLKELEDMGFISGHNCYLYKNEAEIPDLVKIALTGDNWRTVGQNGYLLAQKNGWINRIKGLLEYLGATNGLKSRPADQVSDQKPS